MNNIIKTIFLPILTLLILKNVNASFRKKLHRRRQAEETEISLNLDRINLTELRYDLEQQMENLRFSFLDLSPYITNKIILNLDMPSLIKLSLSYEKFYDRAIVNNVAFLKRYKWDKPSDKSFFILSININKKNWEFVDKFLDQPEIEGYHLITHTSYPSLLVQMVKNQAPIKLIIKVIENCRFNNIWHNHLEFNENRKPIQTYTPLATLLRNVNQYPALYFDDALHFLLKTEKYDNFKEDRTKNAHIHLVIQDHSLDTETKLHILRTFYEFHVNFNEFNVYKENALYLALQNSLDIEIIDFLINHGCKVYSNMFDLVNNNAILDLLRNKYYEDNDTDLISEEESDSNGDFASF